MGDGPQEGAHPAPQGALILLALEPAERFQAACAWGWFAPRTAQLVAAKSGQRLPIAQELRGRPVLVRVPRSLTGRPPLTLRHSPPGRSRVCSPFQKDRGDSPKGSELWAFLPPGPG